MSAQLAVYYVTKNPTYATLFVEGLSVVPRQVGSSVVVSLGWVLEEMASYLNVLAKSDHEHLQLMDRLLEASLRSINLNRIQNEVATCLHYPGIDGYIHEKFSRKEVRSTDATDTSS